MSDIIGKEIGGYRILQQIGVGGMAKVYKAYQAKMDRVVALKVLPDHYTKDETFLKRFDQEARIIANLENRNILSVFDYGEDGGVAFLAMRYLRGGTLKDVLNSAEDRRLSMTDVAHVVSQLANALDYSHSQGIVHRDMKPSNVLVDESGDCYLTDFGIAKVLDSTSHLTSTGSTLGTPAYMSPEQAAGKNVGTHSDIYSLGIILYELMVGKVPFDSDTPFAIVLAHVNEPIPLPSQVNLDIPQKVEQVILKALAKNPDDRYASCGELSTALFDALEAADIHVGGHSSIKVSDTLQRLSGGLAQTRPNDEMTVDDIALAKTQQRKEMVRKYVPAAAVIVFVGMLITIGVLSLRSGDNLQLDFTQAAAMMAEATGTQQASLDATATQFYSDRNAAATQINKNRSATKTVVALTPTAIILPTYTPTPEYYESDSVLFTEDFEDQESSVQFDYTSGDWNIVDHHGNLVLQATNFGSDNADIGPGVFFGTPSWKNYRLSFDYYTEGNKVDFMLFIRAGTGCWYGIGFGTRVSGFQDDRRGCIHAQIPTTGKGSANPGEWNAVTVDVFENTLIVYFNEQEVIHFEDFKDKAPINGGVRIILQGEFPNDNPARIILFDNFRAAELSDDPSSSLTAVVTPSPTNTLTPTIQAGIRLVECGNDLCFEDYTGELTSIGLYPTYSDFWEQASLSPDGAQIVFSGCLLEESGCAPDLYIANRDGSTVTPLLVNSSRQYFLPSWSPNGNWISYHNNGRLAVISLDGVEKDVFVGERYCTNGSSWSPDSQRIAVIGGLGLCQIAVMNRVWVINADSTERTLIFQSETIILDWGISAWSPDGTQVAVLGENGYTYLINVNCNELPGACGESSYTVLDEFPGHWLHTFYPQWAGEDIDEE